MAVLHPLTTLDWEEFPNDLPAGMDWVSAVLFKGKIFAALNFYRSRDTGTGLFSSPINDLRSWRELNARGVKDFGLGVYKSNLVMLGGLLPAQGRHRMPQRLNDVLVSNNGIKWRSYLPPMPTRRASPTVVSAGESPEYLVVAGGEDSDVVLTTVEVLVEGQWYTIKHLPGPCYRARHCFHGEKLFMAPRNNLKKNCISIIFCEVKTLLAHCSGAVAGMEPNGVLWKTIDSDSDVGFTVFDKYGSDFFSSFIVSLGGCLVTAKQPPYEDISGGLQFADWCKEPSWIEYMRYHAQPQTPQMRQLHAQIPSTKSWVCVGELPTSLKFCIAVPISTGELIVICPRGSMTFKMTVAVTESDLLLDTPTKAARMPYNPDSRFSLSALCRLEAAGIRVLRSLSGSVDRLCKELGVNGYKYKFISDYTIERAMTSWVAGECGPEYPPTWDGLLRLMWKLRLKELSRRVEEFFNNNLQEQCKAVIMSALLEQRSLDPKMLVKKLPLPRRLRQSIINDYIQHPK